ILPPSTKLVIVMDGKGSDQKSETHKARMLQRENTLQKMKQLLDQVSSLPSDVRQNITITLYNAGYNVVTAFGEADVYLAKETRKCCISSDSDILFHGKTKTWLVPIIRGNILWVKMVSLNHVLSTLKINLVGLTALGVISGNGYSPNLKGCGIASNYLWLRSISSTQQASVTDIVKTYCEEQETTNAFGKALNVFEHLKETFLRSSVYSNEIKEYSNHLSEIVREFRKAIVERKTSVLDHVKSKPRYTFKKVDITEANKEAVPPVLKTEIQSDRGKSSDNENNKSLKPAAPKMNPRKRNHPAAPYVKSKRAGRNKEGAAEAGASGKRTLTEDHRDLLSLKGKHEQRLWKVGSVGVRVAHGEFEEHSKQILDRLDIVVKRLNVLRRMAQVGTMMLVEHVLKTSSSDTKILDDLVKGDTK
ncbi:hypothetical protein MP638_002330, partial [Amoeboaphelidium occidentale]